MSQQGSYPLQFIINEIDHQVTPIKYLEHCTIKALLLAAKSELYQHQIENNKIIFKHSLDIDLETDDDIEAEFDTGLYTKNKPLRITLLLSFKPKMDYNNHKIISNAEKHLNNIQETMS